MNSFDVVVIGAGPGGYVAAIRAAQLGLTVAIVEKEHLGGVCLNFGCIPTKALLRSATLKEYLDHGNDFGFSIDYTVNFSKVIERSRAVAGHLAKGISGLLKKNKIPVLWGTACFATSNTITLTASDGTFLDPITATHFIIATGARPRLLPNTPSDPRIWTAKEAMIPPFFPKKLLIIGSGAIGIEFASFYCAFGSSVHVVEVRDSILPQEDLEISHLARKIFEKKGITFSLSASVSTLIPKKDGICVSIERGGTTQTEVYDAVIVAIGIIGNCAELGLNTTQVQVNSGHILTNEYGHTNDPSIYAIGDVTGAPWLAHKASHEAIIAIEHIAGLNPHPLTSTNIPGCTYSSPQIASIGLTEEQANTYADSTDRTLKIGRFRFSANGKALALGEGDGMIKTIFDGETGELLGAHMIGAEVTELISILTLGKTAELIDLDFIHTIFPHPTLSEAIHESVLDAWGRAIHA